MMADLENYAVALYKAGRAEYPESPPFHPSENYPEYIFEGRGHLSLDNTVYEAVRSALYLLGLDVDNYGTSGWNPLGKIISPGDKVVLCHYPSIGYTRDIGLRLHSSTRQWGNCDSRRSTGRYGFYEPIGKDKSM